MANVTKTFKRIAQIINASYICAVSRGFLPSFSCLMPDEQSKSRFTTSNVKRFFYALMRPVKKYFRGLLAEPSSTRPPVQRAAKNSASSGTDEVSAVTELSPIFVNRFGRLDCFESAS